MAAEAGRRRLSILCLEPVWWVSLVVLWALSAVGDLRKMRPGDQAWPTERRHENQKAQSCSCIRSVLSERHF